MKSEYFDGVYIEERLEEQRSKLVHIRSTFKQIVQNIKTIQNSCYLQKSAPPIHYSEPIFEDFDRRITQIDSNLNFLKLDLYNIISDQNYDEFMHRHIDIVKDINKLTRKLSCLQHLVDQRAYGLHIFKVLEYHPALISEYGLVGKVYNAVDALSYELMEKLYGGKSVEEMRYVPLSLFGDKYQMIRIGPTEGSFLIMVPYYDCFRARFWPALAHETAHIIVGVAKINKYDSQLYKLMRNKQKMIPMEPVGDYNGGIHPHMEEIFCDILSTYICGPASLFSGSALLSFTSRKMDNFNISLSNAIYRNDHPPIEIRIAAMRKTLSKLGIFTSPNDLEKIIKSIRKVLKCDTKLEHLTPLNEESRLSYAKDYFFITKYKDAINPLTDSVFSFLKSNTHIEPFTSKTWETVLKTMNDGTLDGLTPIELMNVAWMTRLKKGIYDHNLHPESYVDKRMDEAKLFETLVHNMYIYYEKKVAPKLRPRSK